MQSYLRPRRFGIRTILGCFYGALSGLFLFGSLIIINVIQTLSLLTLPFSRRLFRSINRGCAKFWWGMCVVISEKLGRIQAEVSGDSIPNLENAIVVANHQQMPDIVAIMMLAFRKKRIGDLKFFVKEAIKYVPGVGWGMLFLDCLFVRRHWDADAERIQSTFEKFHRDQIPLWLVIYAEGTRIKPEKLKVSQKYAKRLGRPVPEYVMVPRTKGFTASVEGLRQRIDAVYDVTIAYPDGIPSLWQFLQGEVKRIHMHVQRYPVQELPLETKSLDEWLLDRFDQKDQYLKSYFQANPAT